MGRPITLSRITLGYFKQKCLIKKCYKVSYTRGLCTKHYNYLAHKIRKQETTWDELVYLGKAKDKI